MKEWILRGAQSPRILPYPIPGGCAHPPAMGITSMIAALSTNRRNLCREIGYFKLTRVAVIVRLGFLGVWWDWMERGGRVGWGAYAEPAHILESYVIRSELGQ